MRNRKLKRQRKIMAFAFSMLALIVIALTLYAPAAMGTLTATIAFVPIWGYVKDKTFKELKPEEVADLSTEDQIKYFNELNLHKAAQMKDLKEQMRKDASKELADKILELRQDITKDNREQMQILQKAMEEQGIALRKLSGGQTPTKETFEKYLETNKELLVKMVKHGDASIMVIKADTLRANVTDSKVAYQVPDIGQLATRKLTLYDLFAKVPVGPGSGGVVSYYDWDEATTARAAAVIAEGGTFPSSTAKWKWYSKPLVKVGDSLPVSEEFDKDLPQFAAELAQFLQINVGIKTDTELYSGAGTGSEMTGAYTYAGAYTAVASGMQDPSIYDLLVKVRSSMTAGKGSKYIPNFALMNPTDITAYKLKKDANNNYIMPPFVSQNGQIIDSMVIVESSAVAANTLLVGDNRFPKIYEVEGYTLQKGLADGDFMSDMFTLKARRRLMLLVKNADLGALKKVTDIAAALVTLGTAPA